MDILNKSLGKVSIGVPSKPSFFTFVPVVHKLPFQSIISEEETSAALTGTPNKNVAVSHEKTTGETMSDGEIFKAEKVFIKDSLEGGAGNIIQPLTELQLKPSLDHVSLSHTKASPSVSAQSENTPNHAAAGTASMETAVDKHRGISQRQCHDTSGRAEVSSGCFANIASVSDDRMSPTDSADLFPTLASSRESILSEGSDRDKSWSAVQLSSVTSPASFSRTVSPCSSVRSGVFSPSVTQVKRHFLAPGSSLIHIPQTCFSSCESLSSSICPQSPPPRHRPPLTRLSLLTAILRKGRLPVLSSALQRPYTPCWPVNPVTLSFCNACSAASSVASIPLEFSSRFSSSASIDSQSHGHREPTRCITAPPPVQSNELSRPCAQTHVKRCSEQIHSAPRWEQVISPSPVKSNKLPQAPLPLFCSNFKSVSPPEHEETLDCTTSKKLQHTHIAISKSPVLKPSNTHMHLEGHADNNLKKLISLSPKLINEQETSAPQKWSRSPNSSLSRLHTLSQKLRSPPPCPPQLQPPHPRSPCLTVFPARTDAASPLPPSENTAPGRCESQRSCSASKPATLSQGFHKAHCLSPSRYTPISFPGWPSPTSSPAPTPSPAPPIRDLTPSPSLSLRSITPSPRPGSGISDCSDREGKKRKTHKIKLSYKSLAAIPTNTLLLDQQAIDEQVEREDSPFDTLDRDVEDTHAEMCSPAQLRQQSEELYAVIDEILANSIPATSRSSTPSAGVQQNNSTLPKSLGRETKYASLSSLYPSASMERKLMDPRKTKPGVIRPMTAIPRLTVEDEEEFYPNPFRQSVVKQTLTDNKKEKVANMSPEEAGKDFFTSSKGKTMREESKPGRRTPFSLCDLQITEPEDLIGRPVKDAAASFSPSEGRMEAFETHI
ncbi:muscular LMNA-interacting protein isoform X3 [Seriola aureovittata]|uniref:muscular LMNA-interacting protein isoform X3 n=1 Tax=Seriola aureovittata TaxID=2871759 RepID=UPI0024BF0ACC|nr:muscular LMNA-interacting protein isoform X3 [Seriola aureovittata]